MQSNDTLPSYEELHNHLRYDAETGQLWRKQALTPSVDLTKEAGSLMPSGYRSVVVCGKKVYAHRIIWCMVYGKWSDSPQIDHINGNPSDNRICNLREATHTQNAANTGPWKSNRAGLKGVRQVGENRWRARIRIAGKEINLGTHDTKEAAQEAYWKASAEAYGEYARVGGQESTKVA